MIPSEITFWPTLRTKIKEIVNPEDDHNNLIKELHNVYQFKTESGADFGNRVTIILKKLQASNPIKEALQRLGYNQANEAHAFEIFKSKYNNKEISKMLLGTTTINTLQQAIIFVKKCESDKSLRV